MRSLSILFSPIVLGGRVWALGTSYAATQTLIKSSFAVDRIGTCQDLGLWGPLGKGVYKGAASSLTSEFEM